jgi:peptidoglycan/xylan/chitin deacetylase (PgdA/CDA1 family)
MILIVDDRKRFDFFNTLFVPYLKKYNWTVTNAWISHPDTPAYLYKENEQLVPTGLVDFQAHGVIHNVPIEPGVTEAYIRSELYGSITAIQQHFGKAPNTYVWARGLFTPQAVQMARQAGYRLGFTASARGPLLFNWIPLGEVERAANDPLMVLPRYWSTTASANLDSALQFSQAAKAFAQQNQAAEQNWFTTYCKK